MCKMLDQYADKINGIFSFFDRMIVNGYILPLTSEHSRPDALSQLNILYKDFKTYFMDITAGNSYILFGFPHHLCIIGSLPIPPSAGNRG